MGPDDIPLFAMLKMTDARMNYDAAVSFYQKSMAMLKTSTRRPGG